MNDARNKSLRWMVIVAGLSLAAFAHAETWPSRLHSYGAGSAFIGTVPQQVDRCIGVAALELREVQAHEIQAVHLFRDRTSDRGPGLGRDTRQRIELLLGVAPKPSRPRDAEVAE